MPLFQKTMGEGEVGAVVEDEVEAGAKVEVKLEGDLKSEVDHENGESLSIPIVGSMAIATIVIVMVIGRGTAESFYGNSRKREFEQRRWRGHGYNVTRHCTCYMWRRIMSTRWYS